VRAPSPSIHLAYTGSFAAFADELVDQLADLAEVRDAARESAVREAKGPLPDGHRSMS
jgi:hypothetical protein